MTREPEELRFQRLAEFLSGRHGIGIEAAMAALADMKPIERDRVDMEMRGLRGRHVGDWNPFELGPLT